MRSEIDTYTRLTCVMVLTLLIIRVVGLYLSPLGLHGDEAQYWAWSKDLDWGFFTKPPLIAGVIFTTTSLLGDSEWAVRLASPLLHSATAFVIYFTGRTLFDSLTGFWAAAIYILMPAVWLSSGIISTDVPLLLCWAIALNAMVHLRAHATWPRAVQLGLAIGIGLLAKYAMLFFIVSVAVLCLLDRPTRNAIISPKGAVAGLLSLAFITPNILWNARHDFATLDHTAANANMQDGIQLNPADWLTFTAEQFAVFGPLTFVLLLLALLSVLPKRAPSHARWLAVFVVTPLIIISVQALLSRANANWAVTAYVGGALLCAYFAVNYGGRMMAALKLGLGVQSFISLALAIALLVPAWSNAAGLANSVKRLRAWPETVQTIEAIYKAGHEGEMFTHIATDKRITYYDLKYYGLEDTAPLKMWMYKAAPENHAELTAPLPATDGPVLLVAYYDKYQAEREMDFTRLERLPDLDIDLGGGKRRTLQIYAGYGYTPTQRK